MESRQREISVVFHQENKDNMSNRLEASSYLQTKRDFCKIKQEQGTLYHVDNIERMNRSSRVICRLELLVNIIDTSILAQ